jgi:TonB family protein
MASVQAQKSAFSRPPVGMPQGALSEKLNEIASRAKTFTGSGGAAIALIAGEHFITCATFGTSLELGASLPLERNFTQLCPPNRKVLCCNDVDSDSRVDATAYRALKIKSMVIAPLGDPAAIVGVLAVFSGTLNAFTETHVAVLKTLAEVATHLLSKEERLDDLFLHPFNPAVDNPLETSAVDSRTGREVWNQPATSRNAAGPVTNRDDRSSTIVAAVPTVTAPKPPATSKPDQRQRADTTKPTTSVKKAMISNPSPQRIPSPSPQPLQDAKDNGILELASDPLADLERAAVRPADKNPKKATAKPVARKQKPRKWPLSNATRLMTVIGFVLGVLVAFLWVVGGGRRADETQPLGEAFLATSQTALHPVSKPVLPPQSTSNRLMLTMKSNLISTVEAGVLTDLDIAPATRHKHLTPPKPANRAETSQGAPLEPIVVPHNASPARVLTTPRQEAPQMDASIPTNPMALNDLVKPVTPARPILSEKKVVPPELISKVAPIYPMNARSMGIQGAVLLSAKISKSGVVTEVRPLSGNPILCLAAANAVKQWRYKPSLQNGEPVDSTVEIAVHFQVPQ